MINRYAVLLATFVMCQGAGNLYTWGPPIRSDLPLSSTEQWPRSDGTGLGALTMFELGDWRNRKLECPPGGDGCPAWLRWKIGSVFEPYFTFQQTLERQYLAHVVDDAGVVAELGRGPAPNNLDLFAIQFGHRGGSDYLIVAASTERPIRRLTVLDARCQDDNGDPIPLPDVDLRQSDVGVQPTDYCVVKSQAGLRALALDALGRRPAAVMEWVGDVQQANVDPFRAHQRN